MGGGVGLSKNLCGAVNAAALAVGLRFGSTQPTGVAPQEAYLGAKRVVDRFQQRFGSVQCGELTKPWESNFANRERVYRCADFVAFVFEELRDVLSRESPDPSWSDPWWDDYLRRRDQVR